MRQLILQDSHVTYRYIETTLGISGTSIHSLLHEQLTVKQICSRCIPHNLSIAQKTACVDWSSVHLILYEHLTVKKICSPVNRLKKSVNQNGKSASTIGSKACKSI